VGGGDSKRERSGQAPSAASAAAAAAADALANAARKSSIGGMAEEGGAGGEGGGGGGGGVNPAFVGFMESLMANVERPDETEMARMALEQLAVAHLEVRTVGALSCVNRRVAFCCTSVPFYFRPRPFPWPSLFLGRDGRKKKRGSRKLVSIFVESGARFWCVYAWIS